MSNSDFLLRYPKKKFKTKMKNDNYMKISDQQKNWRNEKKFKN